jgi:predicted acylesterase/phospholipase RssA
MDVFIAGITTIPYFEAAKIKGEYYLEGGYTDNTPLRPLFLDDQVEEIIVIDFTDYDYHTALKNIYQSSLFTYAKNSIDLNLLINDIQWCLPNISILSQANFINQLLETLDKERLVVSGKEYFRKPLHILKPSNLESMTISLKDMRAQKDYFRIGQQEIQSLLEKIG